MTIKWLIVRLSLVYYKMIGIRPQDDCKMMASESKKDGKMILWWKIIVTSSKKYHKITVRLLQGGGSVDLKNDCKVTKKLARGKHSSLVGPLVSY
jgi:hypothetical protein